MKHTLVVACEKTPYDTFAEAKNAVGNFKKGRHYGKTGRRFATKKPKRAYKCEFCGSYHLTSQKKERL